MEAVLNTLNTAHEQLKSIALESTQGDETTNQQVLDAVAAVTAIKDILDTIRAVNRLTSAIKQATGL
jgi:hypothetical protein